MKLAPSDTGVPLRRKTQSYFRFNIAVCAAHHRVAEAQFIAPARTIAVQGGSADGHGSQDNKCSHRHQSNKRNRITLCPGLGLIDPATVEELSWSQMYNHFNCNPMLLDLRPASEFRSICNIPLESTCVWMMKN